MESSSFIYLEFGYIYVGNMYINSLVKLDNDIEMLPLLL